MKKAEKKILKKLKPDDKSTEEAIIAHYIRNNHEKYELTAQEAFVDARSQEIFALMISGKPKNWIVNWLLKHFSNAISRTYAYKLIDMTEKIYGNAYKVTQEMAKAMHVHRSTKIYNVALTNEETLDIALKASKEIAIAQGAFDEEKDEAPTIPMMVISTNPEFIRPKIIDVPHEEIEEPDDH
jgi:hypothetical protein